MRIALVGFGAIGQEIVRHLGGDKCLSVSHIVVPAEFLADAAARAQSLCPTARVLSSLDFNAIDKPSLVIECAGHAALQEHIVPALSAGVPCIVASVGALSDPGLLMSLQEAATRGKVRMQLTSGALGALDALSSATVGGLDEVVYVGRKPPLSWSGTPAQAQFDLASLTESITIFDGNARDAARLFPKNANVAASVALAGIGFERTRVQLIADPAVDQNIHRVRARGAFGEFDLELKNLPLQANPKTSALTVYSLVRSIRETLAPVHF